MLKKLALAIIFTILLSTSLAVAARQNQMPGRISPGDYITKKGDLIIIKDQGNNHLQLQSGNISAQTSINITHEQVQERTRLKVQLSNGEETEIKIMPDEASEKALIRLRIKNCSLENKCQIELKEVGQNQEIKVAYELKVQRRSRFLGIFNVDMQVQAQVNAENGEVIQIKKPWWAFLATESKE